MSEIEIQNFILIIDGIVHTESFLMMHTYKHHMKTTMYDHSLKVAYLCYKYTCKHNSNINQYELIRAALLHDYFLYDRINKTNKINRFVHLFKHPQRALKNAIRDYPDLSKYEINAIKRHMFPIVPIPPTTKCGWLICYFDKIAAIGDYVNMKKWKQPLIKQYPDILQ
jgi:uncharacterized protein